MLIRIEDGTPICGKPHLREFEIWKRRLSFQEYEAIKQELDRRVATGEVHTSSWIPGKHWTDTPFQPIYEKACRHNEEQAAQFFGLILWEVMQERPDQWSFGRYQVDGRDIKGLTYFRLAA